ncbi:MAG: twin-arginine translocase TatA/TatE family subunit [Ardenticatenaceae bacterium]|nr:twin-arginine translocase TatA/TatE family subunit [Ardenticatenaceae bacterium]
MPFGLGGPELLIVLVVFLIVFGVGRLPEVGGALGRSIREFRENVQANSDDEKKH